MTRIALFVLAVAALVYVAVETLLAPRLGLEPDPILVLSASLIAGILAWTAFLFRTADRLGRKEDAWHDAGAARGEEARGGEGEEEEARRERRRGGEA